MIKEEREREKKEKSDAGLFVERYVKSKGIEDDEGSGKKLGYSMEESKESRTLLRLALNANHASAIASSIELNSHVDGA